MKLPTPFIKDTDHLNVVIETPKGSRNKYAIDLETHFFHLKKSLPAGMVFPFDFGFIPGTHAEDGDPLDVLVLTDAPTFPGCVVDCEVIGIIKVEQVKQGKKVRNDRVIAVHLDSRQYSSVDKLDDLEEGLVDEIIHFFASYNKMSDDVFKVVGIDEPAEAIKLIKQNIEVTSN